MITILKGTAKHSGDGWKDTTKKGDIAFVYGWQLEKPYAPGQYPRVGNPVWSASVDMFTFEPASLREVAKLIPKVWHDITSPLHRQALARRWSLR